MELRTIDLPGGRVHFRESGPADGRPVVFVHGFLVDHTLWSDVPELLGEQGFRTLAPTWPLGAHTTAMEPGADLSPRGVAHLVLSFLRMLDLTDVTLVGSDTGGAICQLVLDEDASRIGRLVLTNCDAFDTFPPFPFDLLFRLGRHPVAARARAPADAARRAAQQPARLRLAGAPQAHGRREPALGDAVPHRCGCTPRRDRVRAGAGVPTTWPTSPPGSPTFDRPVLLCWAPNDRFFKIDLAHRLADDVPGRPAGGVPRRADLRLARPARPARRGDRSLRRSAVIGSGACPSTDRRADRRRRHLRLGRHPHPLARHRLPRRVAGAGPGGGERPAPRRRSRSPTRLHAAGAAVWGRSRDHQQSATVADLFDEAGLEHDPELLTAYYEFWEPHTFTDPEVGPMFEALRADGIRVGVLSNTHLAAGLARGLLRARRRAPPHRRRRVHQRDPVDEAVAEQAFRAAMEAVGVGRPGAGACTSATGSSTTSGAPTTRGCGRSTSRYSAIPPEQVGHTEGEPGRRGAPAVRDPRHRPRLGLTAGLRSRPTSGLCNAQT